MNRTNHDLSEHSVPRATALAALLGAGALALTGCIGLEPLDDDPNGLTIGGAQNAALDYQGSRDQFAGGFAPSNAPYGGFGGGDCAAQQTPVIFVHGNGDEAKNWDFPAATGVPSVYDSFLAAGYRPCELFGINWLSESENGSPQNNYHRPGKAELLADFIRDVKDYTGADKVDIVAHSLGVTASLHALDYDDLWPSLRRFISIAGGLRGLTACVSVGYANALAPTCGSQNVWNSDIFGLHPDTWYAWNTRMGWNGFRAEPGRRASTFYSIRAGINDQILCSAAGYVAGCDDSALFQSGANVRAQLDVGHGSTAASLDFDLSDWTILNTGGGDSDGVGHFRAKNNTGAIQVNMLTGSCTGTECCDGYSATCQ
jgi:pimeloyl-ACP methyl ester carboxylesterase